jgi:hypothetical protein
MKKAKQFDCVKMKNDIQAKLRLRYRGMTDDQIQAAMERGLASSDSPPARLWRRLTGRPKIAKVAETKGKYTAKRRE